MDFEDKLVKNDGLLRIEDSITLHSEISNKCISESLVTSINSLSNNSQVNLGESLISRISGVIPGNDSIFLKCHPNDQVNQTIGIDPTVLSNNPLLNVGERLNSVTDLKTFEHDRQTLGTGVIRNQIDGISESFHNIRPDIYIKNTRGLLSDRIGINTSLERINHDGSLFQNCYDTSVQGLLDPTVSIKSDLSLVSECGIVKSSLYQAGHLTLTDKILSSECGALENHLCTTLITPAINEIATRWEKDIGSINSDIYFDRYNIESISNAIGEKVVKYGFEKAEEISDYVSTKVKHFGKYCNYDISHSYGQYNVTINFLFVVDGDFQGDGNHFGHVIYLEGGKDV